MGVVGDSEVEKVSGSSSGFQAMGKALKVSEVSEGVWRCPLISEATCRCWRRVRGVGFVGGCVDGRERCVDGFGGGPLVLKTSRRCRRCSLVS